MRTLIKIIQNKRELRQLIKHCETTKYASVDFETTSFKYYDDFELPVMIGTSFQPGSSWVLPLYHKESPFTQKEWRRLFDIYCKGIILNPEICKIAWNLKFEYKWFMRFGYLMRGRLFDAMLGKYCLNEERPHGLKEFTEEYFPDYAGYEKEVNVRKIYFEPLDKASLYCGRDTDITLRSYIYIEPRLIKNGFYRLFRNQLMMASRFLGESEFGGAKIDRPYLESLMKDYEVKLIDTDKALRGNKMIRKFELSYKKQFVDQFISKIKLEIKEIKRGNSVQKERMINSRKEKIRLALQGNFTGKGSYEGFNFRSPKQMANLLYESEFGFKFKVLKKTAGGQPSSDEETLLKLRTRDKHGFIDHLLKYRELDKLDSTYIRGMHKLVYRDSRVHANFHIAGTVTGRLSCVEPNLQNIPRDTTAKDIKRMFIPPQGFVLVEVDYSQAELRMVAELAQDTALIEIFKKNYNVHVATACKMFKGDYDTVKAILKDDKHKDWLKWEKQKKKAKSLNFSILYLQGDEATAETLECSVAEAKKFKREWFNQFPQVEKWIKKQISFAKKNEYVPMLFGRKRRLYEIHSMKDFLRAEAERQAVNAPIQGTSGDFTTFSEVIIREKILTGEFPLDIQQAYRVHDSIGLYMRPEHVHLVIPKIVKICDNPETEKYFGFKLKHVSMKVSPEVGAHWADLKDYDPWVDYRKLLIAG